MAKDSTANTAKKRKANSNIASKKKVKLGKSSPGKSESGKSESGKSSRMSPTSHDQSKSNPTVEEVILNSDPVGDSNDDHQSGSLSAGDVGDDRDPEFDIAAELGAELGLAAGNRITLNETATGYEVRDAGDHTVVTLDEDALNLPKSLKVPHRAPAMSPTPPAMSDTDTQGDSSRSEVWLYFAESKNHHNIPIATCQVKGSVSGKPCGAVYSMESITIVTVLPHCCRAQYFEFVEAFGSEAQGSL